MTAESHESFGVQAVRNRTNEADLANISGEIIVGLDGSEQSYGGLLWAAHEAKLRQVPLRIVTAYSLPVFTGSGFDSGYTVVDEEVLEEGVAQILDEAQKRLGALADEVELRTSVQTGDASVILLELSKRAELMVVGSRSHGSFLGRLLGTVSTSLPAHSHCPTVAVPQSYAEKIADNPAVLNEKQPVVVGSDGSDQARIAMLKAAEEAERRGVKLVLVNALAPYTGALNWVPAAVDFEAVYREIAALQRKAAEWIRSYFPSLEIEFKLIDGSPAQVLVEEGKNASLMVVGTRGRGGLAGMVLGSTSQGVLHHAHTPLMVVPELEDSRIENAPSADITWG
ncbi:universal stress protein [Rothia sp. ZJ1223]|uniref:universal stress protein n=1 Tax=Rothia sp. ZJ1223 TaxID=2811098 RepID=UPI00195840ED|nr:universal stress protein [Rothia sp. ZJ1223]MBM7051681.1 universal stress protein [Rothia sp. ZJ1223]